MEISQLFATLGFKVDNKGLEQFQSSIKGVQKSLGMLKNALYGFGLYQFTKQTMDAVVELDKLSKATDISKQTLQEWQMVAERNNISKNVIDDTFKKIADERSKILTGGKPNNYWRLLGIDPLGKPEESFKNILKQIEKIQDVGIRNQRLKQLGLSQDLIGLVGKNQGDYNLYPSKLGVLDDQQMNSILELNETFKDLWQSLKMLKDYLVYLVSPFKIFIEFISRCIHIAGTFIKSITNSKDAIKGLSIVLAALFVYFNPLISIIMAVCLVIEDLWVYFNGGESVIGKLVEKFPALGTALEVVKAIFLGFIEVIKSVLETLGQVGDFLAKVLPGIFEGFMEMLKFIGNGIKTYLIDPIMKAWEYIKKLKFWGKKDKGENGEVDLSNLQDIGNNINSNPIASNNTKNSVIDNKTVNNNVTVNTNSPAVVQKSIETATGDKNRSAGEAINVL